MMSFTTFVIFCDDHPLRAHVSKLLRDSLEGPQQPYTLISPVDAEAIEKLKTEGGVIFYVLQEEAAVEDLEKLRSEFPNSYIVAVQSGDKFKFRLSEIEEYTDDLLELSSSNKDVLGFKLRKIVDRYRNTRHGQNAGLNLKPQKGSPDSNATEGLESKRLSRALSIGDMGYWWFNLELMEVYWSDELYALFGLSPEGQRMTFETFLKFIHPDDLSYFTASTLADLPSNIHEPLDYRVVLKDGRTRWMRSTPSLVSEKNGRVTVIEGVTQDVTTFKENEARLYESEELYRVLFDKAPLMKLIFDPGNYVIHQINQQTETFFGYPPEELIGMKVHHLFQQSEGWEKAMSEIIELALEGSFEATCLKADQSKAAVIVYATYFEMNGAPVVQFTLRDITKERTYIEEILQLSLIVSKTDNAIIITDANENIEFVNKGFERLFGYTAAEMLGKNPNVLQGKDTSLSDRANLRRCIDARKPFKSSILNYTKYGRPLWIGLSITPIFDDDGKLVKFIAIESDITERKVEAMKNELFAEISQSLNASGDLPHLLKQMFEKIGERTGHVAAEAWLINMDKSHLHRVAVQGNDSSENPKSEGDYSLLAKGEGLAGKIWAEGGTRYWKTLDVAWLPPSITGADEENITSALGVPIGYKNEMLGVFMLYYTARQPIKPYYQAVLSGLSRKVGLELRQKIAEQQLNAFFNLSPDLMCIAGADGFLKKVNKSFIKIIGYPIEDFINKPLINFIHPDDRAKTLESILDISNNQVIHNVNRVLSKAGEVKWISWTGFADIGQQLFYIVGREITRERALELEKANHLKTLEVQNEKLREIAWTQSHIVRAPLTRLMSVIDLMQRHELNEEDKMYLLESMGASASELDTIIKDMIRGSSGVINKKP